jgi:hypothetical protein
MRCASGANRRALIRISASHSRLMPTTSEPAAQAGAAAKKAKRPPRIAGGPAGEDRRRITGLAPAARRCAASMLGWLANSAIQPGPPAMPELARLFGSGSTAHAAQARSALIIGRGEPIRLAAPASARNSRWRENQATMMLARTPNRMSQTITVIM